MIVNKADEIDKKTIETKDITDLNKSFLPKESKACLSDFSNFESLDFYSPNIDFSDMITSSSKYTQSISDADLLLNEISSKLFQSEGYYSTLLCFYEQMKVLVYDQGSNISHDGTTVSLTCKSIIDQTIKLQEENIQMKLSIQKLSNTFLNKKEPDTKENSALYYINLIDEFIKKNDQNQFNLSNTNSEKNDQQKIEKMSKIINDLKAKVSKLKKQKYLSDGFIKRIERQLKNDNFELTIENNDEKYDMIVNEIVKLQKRSDMFSKVYQTIQSNFVDEKNFEIEKDPSQILRVFENLKKEVNFLKKENENIQGLLRSSELNSKCVVDGDQK